jgi:hypothetical protein
VLHCIELHHNVNLACKWIRRTDCCLSIVLFIQTCSLMNIIRGISKASISRFVLILYNYTSLQTMAIWSLLEAASCWVSIIMKAKELWKNVLIGVIAIQYRVFHRILARYGETLHHWSICIYQWICISIALIIYTINSTADAIISLERQNGIDKMVYWRDEPKWRRDCLSRGSY